MKEILASLVVTFGLPLMMPVLVGASPKIDEKQAVVETVENSSSEKTNNTLETKNEINYDIRFIPSEMAKQKLKEQKEIILTKVKGEEIKKKEIEDFFPKGMSEEIILKDQYNQLLTLSEIDGMRVDESITFDLLLDSDNNGSEDLKSSESQSGDIQIEQSKAEETETEVMQSRTVPLPPVNLNELLPLDKVFADPVGSGPKVLSDKNVLQITATNKQLGAIWSKNKVNLVKDFKLRSWIYLGDRGEKAADGITFTLHADPDGVQSLGSDGSGIGAYGSRFSDKFIRNALSFEFDTFNNDYRKDPVYDETDKYIDDGKRGHVAFVRPRADINKFNMMKPSHKHTKVLSSSSTLSDGRWHKFDVDWDANNQILKVRADFQFSDGNQTIEYDLGQSSLGYPDINQMFGGSYEVYWGFTGSTGEGWAENAIAMRTVPNSVSHIASLKNHADNSYSEKITTSKGSTVDIKDHLILDDKVNSKFTKDAQIVIDLKDLSYQRGTLEINGQKVKEENIGFDENNRRLTITLGDMASGMGWESDLTFQAKVLESAQENETNKYRFIYLDEGVVSDSNDIEISFVKTQNPEAISHYSYFNDDNKLFEVDLKKDEEVVINDYIEVKGNNFTENDTVRVKLEDLDYQKGTLEINGEKVDEKQIDYNGDVLRVRLGNLASKLNFKANLRLKAKATIDQNKTNFYNFYYQTPNRDETPANNTIVINFKQGPLNVLRLKEVPEIIDFGKHEIKTGHKDFWSQTKGDLVVEEFRAKNAEKWTLTVREKEPLTNQLLPKHNLMGKMVWNDLKGKKPITKNETIVEQYKHEGDYKVNDTWEKDQKGISIEVPIDKQLVGTYKGELQWQLRDTP